MATISTVTVLIINPAQMTAQSRDARRLTELKSLNSALSLAEVNNIPMGSIATVYVSLPDDASPACDSLSLPSLPVGWEYACSTLANHRKVDGSGWVPVDFGQISYGSPLSVLPVDQVNDAVGGFYYTYTIEGGWELNAKMESSAYNAGGAKDVVSNDGGDTDLLYEASGNLALIPSQINDRSGAGATSVPTVATLAASSVTISSATLNGSANPNNAATTGWFRYDTVNPGSCNNAFGVYVPGPSLGSGNVAVDYSQGITGLVAGNTYYFCAIAENANGKAFGNIISFMTLSLPGRYWVGGTGNWNDTAHWSTSSGGVGGASVPYTADDVYFDANSFTAAGQIVTINVTADTKNMNWTGVANNPTLTGTSLLNINGSLTFVSGMTVTYTGLLTFYGDLPSYTITLAGKTLGGVGFAGNAGGNGGWTLQDAFSVGNSTVTLTRGSLNTNNQTVTCGSFNSSNSNTRSLTLGSSLITCSSSGTPWNFATVTGLTFNAGTSQIALIGSSPTFAGGGLAYNNVVLNSAGTVTISGVNTFSNLTRNGTAAVSNRLVLGASQTITGNLTIRGDSASNRLFVLSSAMGTARVLTAASVSFANVDFQDISGAGAASPFSGTSLGNALGNSNINFTAAATRYWVGNSGSWNSAAEWSASSGGASGASVPLPQDTVIFDANSITLAGQTITVNMPRLGADINFSAVANNPILSFNSVASIIFGSLTLGSNMTISGGQNITFSPRSAVNLINSGRIFTNLIFIDAIGGAVTIQDAFFSNGSLTLTRGTLTVNNQNVTAIGFGSSNSNTRTLNMGNGIWTLTGVASAWNTSTATNLNLNAGASTIVLNNNTINAKTFAGGGKLTITSN